MLPKENSTFHYQGYKYHVVMTFEDRGEVFVVVKYYGKHKRWWHYEVWSLFEFELKTGKDKT